MFQRGDVGLFINALLHIAVIDVLLIVTPICSCLSTAMSFARWKSHSSHLIFAQDLFTVLGTERLYWLKTFSKLTPMKTESCHFSTGSIIHRALQFDRLRRSSKDSNAFSFRKTDTERSLSPWNNPRKKLRSLNSISSGVGKKQCEKGE